MSSCLPQRCISLCSYILFRTLLHIQLGNVTELCRRKMGNLNICASWAINQGCKLKAAGLVMVKFDKEEEFAEKFYHRPQTVTQIQVYLGSI